MTEGPIAVMDDYMGELKLTTRKLRRSAHRSVTELEAGIRKWINELNNDPRPFVWTKTADEILGTLAAYCQRISQAG